MREIRLETRRLVLSPLTLDDAGALFAYRSDPDVCRFQGFEPRTLDDAVRFIESVLADDAPWRQFGIRLRETGALVGDVGVRLPPDMPRQAEIGITLAPAHQHRGLASEALRALFDHLFREAGLHRVFGSVDPENAASIALLERVGMRREAHFRESLLFKGRWVDDVVYGVLALEF